MRSIGYETCSMLSSFLTSASSLNEHTEDLEHTLAAQAEKMRQLEDLLHRAKEDNHYDLTAFQERRYEQHRRNSFSTCRSP